MLKVLTLIVWKRHLDYFENNKEEAFTEGVKQEKKKYEWNTFIDAFVGLYNKVK